ncbi:MAG TPA: 1-(5-phosphoribosyl)-5-((5-phosphoribosylamino)methylideneamino)imidazole-4-carboxamide isomerase [Janthinobacterium sp.]|nr:1-(5-phosphoribosyl)-5-((5-phosphoribosylamino)methylideneamino)imidazole-4-carboxamide isomerase [Janthinobacterium sp.]
MTGSKQSAPTPQPTALTVHSKSRLLDVAFDDGAAFSLPFELLRVYSPSAEVRGHGQGQEVLQVGKREVGVTALEPVGNYAVQPTFSDGHNTGLYSWDYLYKLGAQQEQLWQDYLNRLHAAGFAGDSGREAGAALPAKPAAGHACGHKH